MQCAFEQLLSYAGKVSHKTLKFPKVDDVAKSDLKSEIECVYGKLDGILPSSPLNLRHWDTEFDEIAVELDEELHFNRYRSITLKSAIYTRLPQFPLDTYGHFCSDHEDTMCNCSLTAERSSARRSTLGHDVSHRSAHKPDRKPPQREIAETPKQEKSQGMDIGLSL